MASRHSIHTRRTKRRIGSAFDLQLTSMLDILVIILVFLLKSVAISSHHFSTPPGMKLPLSASPDLPIDSLQVILTPEAVTFDDERILDFIQSAEAAGTDEAIYEFKKEDLDEGNRRIVPLYEALIKAKEKSELLRAKSKARDEEGNPLPFDGVLAIQADKRIHYDTIRKVMYTAAAAGFSVFRFLAMQKEM